MQMLWLAAAVAVNEWRKKNRRRRCWTSTEEFRAAEHARNKEWGDKRNPHLIPLVFFMIFFIHFNLLMDFSDDWKNVPNWLESVSWLERVSWLEFYQKFYSEFWLEIHWSEHNFHPFFRER